MAAETRPRPSLFVQCLCLFVRKIDLNPNPQSHLCIGKSKLILKKFSIIGLTFSKICVQRPVSVPRRTQCSLTNVITRGHDKCLPGSAGRQRRESRDRVMSAVSRFPPLVFSCRADAGPESTARGALCNYVRLSEVFSEELLRGHVGLVRSQSRGRRRISAHGSVVCRCGVKLD